MERARGILAKARATLANERIWMKSALVERERGETDEARQPVLTPLSFHIHRRIAGLAQSVCMRPARLGKPVGDRGVWQCTSSACPDGRVLCLLQELKLLNEGISKFPYFHKFYLMLGQLEERRGSADAARQAYQAGLKRCMGSAPLWRSLSRLEERAGMIGKARNVLEQVRCMPPLARVSRSISSRYSMIGKARNVLEQVRSTPLLLT